MEIIIWLMLCWFAQTEEAVQAEEEAVQAEEEAVQAEEEAVEAEEPPQPQVPQKVEVIRFSDRVVVKNNQTAEEKVLFYNDKLAILAEGDEVRQGTSAISECRFEDEGILRFFSRARFRFGTLSREKHVIMVDDFTRVRVQAREDVTLLLPGGTRLITKMGDCYLEKDMDFIKIRNAGFYEIKLSGHLVDPEDEVVPAGHSISIPLYDLELRDEKEPIVVREVAGRIVKTTGGYSFEEKPGFIIVSRPDPADGMACVGGTRIFLKPGEKIKIRMP